MLHTMGAPYMAMDGINEKGFSIGVLEIKSKATKQNTGKKPIITTVAIRASLDKCETENEAMKLLSEVTLNYQHEILKHQVITLWSAVYNCNEKSMLLCAAMNYGKKYKFFVDKPGEVF